MGVSSVVEHHFPQIQTEIETGTNGKKYIASRNGKTYFVKAQPVDAEPWTRTVRRKEQVLSQTLELPDTTVPDAPVLIEQDGVIAIGFETVPETDGARKLYDSLPNYQRFLQDITEVLSRLREVDVTPGSELARLEGQEHYVAGELCGTETFMFDVRLSGGVDCGAEYYDEYADFLAEAVSRLDDLYASVTPSFVHGDLHAVDNVVLGPYGSVEAVVDWEVAGWFDWLFDVASIEARFVDTVGIVSPRLDRREERTRFRDLLGLSADERERLQLYKVLVHYRLLESAESKLRPQVGRSAGVHRVELDGLRHKLQP